MAKKKNKIQKCSQTQNISGGQLSHYPSFFSFRLLFRTISWTFFAIFFTILGKKCLETDILGKIHHFLWGNERSFNQYFLGTDKIAEKSKILNYAIFFLVAIIVLNILVLAINRYLWKKDKYIENNNFYLHNKFIFIINSLVHIASACLLTASFVSATTVILALLFITYNSWEPFPRTKHSKIPHLEKFFSWQNRYVRKILIYSTIIIFVVPFIIGRIQTFHTNALTGSPEGFSKLYQDLINSSSTAKIIMGLITQTNFSIFHWFVLLWFVKGTIGNRWKDFTDFWVQVNGITPRVTDFKHYYYYQESWAQANNKHINLGDYSYLENSPNFLKNECLESDLEIDDFARQNQKVVKYIEFCEKKIKEPAKRNFLNYCLFNEFGSWDDCLRTKRLIEAARK
ncbi:membrane protein of unknown function [endosymbiont DhMRE of Dentiscutata heterogama]|uniref:hypothetical protein n=1 Tax=endosymbiont DhMRE of Dentiscutata heterogama TaxID=1609546 RepID=UPI000629D2EF|nr:hypothetical protein [endosymbiont DhMRE of Dentiscutata heterogama]CFW93029.1 membrane protein of unknown function [endosymbiont DhMRE of Dentiscutata heterogama]